mgnify:CR=1 FL=1
MDTIPQQIQDKLTQFQELQNQLQSMSIQRYQLRQQLLDIENALETLENVKNRRVYERAGPIFVEVDIDKTRDKLRDDKETKEAQLRSLEKQETKLRERLNEIGRELQSQLGGNTGNIGGIIAE